MAEVGAEGLRTEDLFFSTAPRRTRQGRCAESKMGEGPDSKAKIDALLGAGPSFWVGHPRASAGPSLLVGAGCLSDPGLLEDPLKRHGTYPGPPGYRLTDRTPGSGERPMQQPCGQEQYPGA